MKGYYYKRVLWLTEYLNMYHDLVLYISTQVYHMVQPRSTVWYRRPITTNQSNFSYQLLIIDNQCESTKYAKHWFNYTNFIITVIYTLL